MVQGTSLAVRGNFGEQFEDKEIGRLIGSGADIVHFVFALGDMGSYEVTKPVDRNLQGLGRFGLGEEAFRVAGG